MILSVEQIIVVERSMNDNETLDAMVNGELIAWIEEVDEQFIVHPENETMSEGVRDSIISLCEDYTYEEKVTETIEKQWSDYYAEKNSERINIY
jgi:hypothetical protein